MRWWKVFDPPLDDQAHCENTWQLNATFRPSRALSDIQNSQTCTALWMPCRMWPTQTWDSCCPDMVSLINTWPSLPSLGGKRIRKRTHRYCVVTCLHPSWQWCTSLSGKSWPPLQGWLYPRWELEFVKKLGEGQFGEVLLMIACVSTTHCVYR